MKKDVKTYVRFPIPRRIEHILLLSTFLILASTGLPQKYPNSPISVFVVHLLGGIDNLYRIHHATTVVVMISVTYHLLTIAYQVFVLRSTWSMMLFPQDIKDAIQALLYNLGFAKTPPKMGRYTFEEKFEYWAFVWGYTVMAVTGFIMWNPVTSFKYIPGEIFPAARAAHGGEAVLAVLAIIVWHMYHVRIKRTNNAMFTGKLEEEVMEEEHPLELEEIKSGTWSRQPDSATLRKRKMIYYPIAVIFTVIMLFGAYKYVTIEQTAVDTVPSLYSQTEASP